MIKKVLGTILLLFLINPTLMSQESNERYFEPGIEIQQYPTGFLLGIRGSVGITTHQVIELRLGYNLLDHQDFGEHDDEIGGGFGFTLGYRYFFKSDHRKWFLGARADIWFNEVDWKDNINTPNEVQGTTNVTVLQPTLIGGYYWALNEHFAITPTLAAGAEINIVTEGAEVGQGPILLWGINLTYRL